MPSAMPQLVPFVFALFVAALTVAGCSSPSTTQATPSAPPAALRATRTPSQPSVEMGA